MIIADKRRSTNTLEETSKENLEDSGYVTVLSTKDYAAGILALNESLRITHSKYKLWVLIGASIDQPTINALTSAGLICIVQEQSVKLPPKYEAINEVHNLSHWNHTLDKLAVFSLCQFKKLVYLDSDMIVVRNIDHLFLRPHLSAVSADASFPGHHDWVTLNSGLMVIEPAPHLTSELIRAIPSASRSKMMNDGARGVGDQDVIHELYKNWQFEPQKKLPEIYNMFAHHLDFYINQLKFSWVGPNRIAVIHYVGPNKPWMLGGLTLLRGVARLLKNGQMNQCLALCAHAALLQKARRRLSPEERTVLRWAGRP